jgi:tricorn protease-like protein
MATSGTNVYVVWLSNLTGHFEILFRVSSDNGQTFVDKVNLSNTPNVDSIDPQIAASGNDVYISWWEDYGNGTRVPFFKASNDNGHTFQSVLSLSDNGPIPVQENNNINSG